MKKVLAIVLVTGLVFAGCKEKEENNGTGNLEPAQEQRALVMETTGSWCGFCPNGAEMMIQEEHNFGSDMMGIALHTGDALETPTASAFSNNFPTSGVPNFYVGNQNSGQSIAGNIANLIAQSPMAGVVHNWTRSGDKINIKSKVKFYEAGTGIYYVGTYFIQGDIEASGSLTQADYTDRLEIVDGVSKWKVDAAPVNSNGSQKYLIKAGDTYLHAHTLTSSADGLTTWGEAIPVAPVSGDEYTMNFTITIPSTAATSGMKVLTVLWKDDGSGGVQYVNGYMK
ncbi:MAG: Omp28-related outer membrane protein [Flavobacteriales bacterium]|nr:Omp28-related outer membrane protein [Flavobacteriales bacterium]